MLHQGSESSLIKMMEWIEETQSEILICVYLFTLKELYLSVRSLKPSVKVFILTDMPKKIFERELPKNNKSELLDALLNTEVRYCCSKGKMHNKFAIRDKKSLLNGSLNWTKTAVMRNEENVTITSKIEMVESFRNEFWKLWSNAININDFTLRAKYDKKK